MEFLASLPTYADDLATQVIWTNLLELLGDTDGICYYRHPIISSTTNQVPDLTILAKGYQPVAIRCMNAGVDELSTWQQIVLDLEDYVVGLNYRFEKHRDLRRRFDALGVLALPQITRQEFEGRYGAIPEGMRFIWANQEAHCALVPTEDAGDNARLWALAKSVFQGVSPINKSTIESPGKAPVMGEAIRLLEKDIALLDSEQHKVAIQIAPGPQQIRGLAGTGKTVVLAMKAANIHLRYPGARILFTFNTQSLYNQTKSLITKFYRMNSDDDPNWDQLHVLHAWGGQGRSGVYSELCRRYDVKPLTFAEAKQEGGKHPLAICCLDVSEKVKIQPFYDYVLVDEAQDFPKEFFDLLYRLCSDEKRLCWAYDELQSLSVIDVPSPTVLFGLRADGHPRVSLEGEYPGGIQKDFALHRSYRCQLNVLMLAHGVGLGIHAPRGCVQMLSSRPSWESIGYEVHMGNFQEGDTMEIYRPTGNSPSRLSSIYAGQRPMIQIESFQSTEEELTWISDSIRQDIADEGIPPEQILVICLDKLGARGLLTRLQSRLAQLDVMSIIPGIVQAASDFAEAGRVTLSTVHRAKGNEAPVVYICAFDNLYQYVEEIEYRNRAFTAISRSKGWVRITGSGKRMTDIGRELDAIVDDIPYFRFVFPDIDKIKRLDVASETARRRAQVRKGKESADALLNLEKDALAASIDRDSRERLKQLLNDMTDAD